MPPEDTGVFCYTPVPAQSAGTGEEFRKKEFAGDLPRKFLFSETSHKEAQQSWI